MGNQRGAKAGPGTKPIQAKGPLGVAYLPGSPGEGKKMCKWEKGRTGLGECLASTMATTALATLVPANCPDPKSPKGLRLIDYLSILFGIITVVSLFLAYYWHAQSVQERAPRYYVGSERTRIVDTSITAPPQLQVLYKGKDLNANVSALILYFWNDGKLSIKAADILEPLAIQLDSNCDILDARILKVSREVTKFAKGEISESAKNSLPIAFNILEHGDGALLQIIYAGPPNTQVRMTGTIEGPGTPKEVTVVQANRETRKSKKVEVYVAWISVVGMTGLMFFMGQLSAKQGARRFERPIIHQKRIVIFSFLGCLPSCSWCLT